MSDDAKSLSSASTEAETTRSQGWAAYFRMFKYADRLSICLYTIGVICMAASGTALPILDLIFGQFVNTFNDFAQDAVSVSHFRSQIAQASLYLVYLAIAKLVVFYVGTVTISFAAMRTVRALRIDCIEKTLRQEISFFDSANTGSVAVKVTTNASLVQQGMAEKFGLIVQALSALITAFVVALAVQWKLALITICIIPAIIITTGISVAIDASQEAKCLQHYSQAGNLATEVFSSIRLVHAYWSQPRMIERHNQILDDAKRQGMRKSLNWGILYANEFFFVFAGYALAFWQGIHMYAKGEIQQPGKIITVIFTVLVAAQSVTQVAPQMQVIAKAASSAEKLLEVIDRKSRLDPLSGEGERPSSIDGEIELTNINFAYPSRPDVSVLNDFSLKVPANSTIALVGASGSGKSTIVGLMERWYEPNSGTIKIDGRDVRDLDVQWLRTQVRFVQQEPVLFNTTIYENVRLGLVGAADLPEEEIEARVVEACKDANADNFIRSLPEGYQTVVGERASMLSGGQKQRIAIARSIISNPKILLLDEATSALDPEAEQQVQKALDRLQGSRTTIVIAHKLSTVKNADRIIVLEKGVIKEHGSHAELLTHKGAYYRLVMAQDLGNEKAEVEEKSSHNANEAAPKLLRQQSIGISEHVDETASDRPQSMGYSLLRCFAIFVKERPECWVNLFIIGLACVVGGLTYPAIAILITQLITTFQLQGAELVKQGNFFALMLFIVALINCILYFVCGYVSNVVCQVISRQYREEMFENIIYQDMEYFDLPENGVGAMVSHLSQAPSNLLEFIGLNSALLLIVLIMLVSSAVTALIFGWKLALVAICTIMVPVVGMGYGRLKMEIRLEEATDRLFSDSAATASEAVTSIRTVASLALEQHVINRYQAQLRNITRRSSTMLFTANLFFAIAQAIEFAAMALALWYGARLLSAGEYSTTQFFTVFIAVIFAAEASVQFIAYSTSMSKARAGANHILWLRSQQPRIGKHDRCSSTSATTEKPNDDSLAFTLDEVEFAYSSRPQNKIIKDLDIQINKGDFVAFVGASGCGKSTIVSLLERFYEPVAGRVRHHEQDINTICPRRYREQIAYVQQEPTLFQASVRDNILLGTVNSATEAELEAACRQSNIWDFVSSLPEGLDTDCGAGGTRLSGGQRQRVSIARALIRQPQVLLLDEATSALDTESEKLVQQAIAEASTGRTTLAIAHRLSTIKDADKIFVLHQGRIVERGSHVELIRQQGIYFRLCQSQSL